MSGAQFLAEAERVLLDLERDVQERIEAMKESTTAPVMGGAIGRLTHIDAYQQQQMALHGQRQLKFQLDCIRGALARVKAGTYGLCVECGIAIPPERLEVAPETPFCVDCKGRIDQKHRL